MSLKSEGARSVLPRVVEEVLRPRATDLAVRLAEQVRRLRIQAALTQAELALAPALPSKLSRGWSGCSAAVCLPTRTRRSRRWSAWARPLA